MKLFTKIHILFAIFFIAAYVAGVFLLAWLRSLHELPDASHSQFYFWQPRVKVIYYGLTYGATISWLLFAIYHLFTIIRQIFQPKDKH